MIYVDERKIRGHKQYYKDLKKKNKPYIEIGRKLRRIPNLTYLEFRASVKGMNGSIPWHIIRYMYHDYLTYQDEEIYNEYSQKYL